MISYVLCCYGPPLQRGVLAVEFGAEAEDATLDRGAGALVLTLPGV
jgi:hypothetical protein